MPHPNNVARRNSESPLPEAPEPEGEVAPAVGRPRRWASPAEKHRAHRARKAALTIAVGELLHAVRNARLEDPALQQAAHHGEDVEVVEALAAYYGARHWQQPRCKP